MLNINFVPDDYIQTNESSRTNLMYLVLFVVVMAGLAGAFTTIKVRQRALDAQEKLVNEKMLRAQEAIKQFEEMQTKRRAIIKTALTTADLLESVPRSVLLASLTNSLPSGVSLLKLNFIQKEVKTTQPAVPATQYKTAEDAKAAEPKPSPEQLLETYINIEGIAPSDRQVAAYIGRLSNSELLDNVALVESKEYKGENTMLRQFKLTALLKRNAHPTKETVENIKNKV